MEVLVHHRKSSVLILVKQTYNFASVCISISTGFGATDSREGSLNGSACDVSVDYNYIGKSDILNIHKHFMTKNNIK